MSSLSLPQSILKAVIASPKAYHGAREWYGMHQCYQNEAAVPLLANRLQLGSDHIRAEIF